jgi:hypothetical protein
MKAGRIQGAGGASLPDLREVADGRPAEGGPGSHLPTGRVRTGPALPVRWRAKSSRLN